jgi:hypothetical protein
MVHVVYMNWVPNVYVLSLYCIWNSLLSCSLWLVLGGFELLRLRTADPAAPVWCACSRAIGAHSFAGEREEVREFARTRMLSCVVLPWAFSRAGRP